MSTVNFIEAMETLKSMFPELDTVTVRDVLDKHGGFMEGAVEELLGISRAKRGMGGGGHANNPVFMFQADWAKNKWKGAVFVVSVVSLGTYIPWACIKFAQKKAGVW